MPVGALHNASRVHSSFERALQYSFGDMVALFPPRARVDGKTRRRKNVLPSPLARRVRRFPSEGEWKVDTAKPIFQILVVLCFDSQQMTTKWFIQIHWKHCDAVFPAFRVAHSDLCERKIDVFDSQTNAFHQAQSATVEQPSHQFRYAVKMRENFLYLTARQNHRQLRRFLRAFDFFQPADLMLEDFLVEKE
jgi:hypothetical protein